MGSRRDTPEAVALLQTVENEDSLHKLMIFEELRLHKAFFDENLCTEIAVARRITACYSRGRNCAVGCENTCFFEKYAQKIEVPAPRRARYSPAFFTYNV